MKIGVINTSLGIATHDMTKPGYPITSFLHREITEVTELKDGRVRVRFDNGIQTRHFNSIEAVERWFHLQLMRRSVDNCVEHIKSPRINSGICQVKATHKLRMSVAQFHKLIETGRRK